jgi:integrase
MSLILIGNM